MRVIPLVPLAGLTWLAACSPSPAPSTGAGAGGTSGSTAGGAGSTGAAGGTGTSGTSGTSNGTSSGTSGGTSSETSTAGGTGSTPSGADRDSGGSTTTAAAGGTGPVAETEPQAKQLGYVTEASRYDKARFPNKAPDAHCANCALYQGAATAAMAPCAIFGGRQVHGPGWCSAWSKKA